MCAESQKAANVDVSSIHGEKAMDYAVRVMTAADYDEVYALWMGCKNMGFNNVDDSRRGIEKYLARNPKTSFVAVSGGEICGVILSGHDGRRGFIHHMAVKEVYRGKGIGRDLVQHALQALKEEGISKVGLFVFGYNEGGNAFWEKMGFALRTDINYRNLALTELVRNDT